MEFNTSNIKIVFMGTPQFAVPSLEALVETGYIIQGVITNPDRPAERGQHATPTPVKLYAQSKGLAVLTPSAFKEIRGQLEAIKPDIIIVTAYGKILPSWTLLIPKYGALNVHPSLLPRWRGASPIPFTILEGDAKTGVTIIQMNEKMDEGPIISDFRFQISDLKTTTRELTEILAKEGAKLLIETLPQWIQGKITPVPQNDEGATYSRILAKEDGHIIWTKTAQVIERQIRAFSPWPGTFSYIPTSNRENNQKNSLLFKILDADWIPENFQPKETGKVTETQNGDIAVQTGSGLLLPTTVQLEGKKPMNIREFVRGRPDFIGNILQ